MSSHSDTSIAALLKAYALPELEREPLSTSQVIGRMGILATPAQSAEIERLLEGWGYEQRPARRRDSFDDEFYTVYLWHATLCTAYLNRKWGEQAEPYVGQPNPGARIPLPVGGPKLASPFGRCACGKPADAMVRKLFQQPEPACAACAAKLGATGVIALHLLDQLPDTFRLEHAMRALDYDGTGIQLARTLADFGFVRERRGDGFVWQRRRAA